MPRTSYLKIGMRRARDTSKKCAGSFQYKLK